MAKDHVRDYATEAFRFYAKSGGLKNYIRDLTADLQKQKGSGTISPTEGAIVAKERMMEEKAAELADLEAVERTMHILTGITAGKEIRQAIEYVYFYDCWKDLQRGDIEARVHYAELHIPASRRQIYRWLKRARMIFAEERGLRI